jgi:NADH-quinone oxidoreductase subunit L
MLIPLGVLSLGAVLRASCSTMPSSAKAPATSGRAASPSAEHLIHAMHEVPTWVKWAPFAVMATGLAVAWYGYIRQHEVPGGVRRAVRPLYKFLLNKWYFDELYQLPVRRARLLAWPRVLEAWAIIGMIDRFGPNGAAWVVAAGQPRRAQGPVGLSLFLCAGHAARACRRDQLGDGGLRR